MICERCGSFLPDDEVICHVCGAMLHRSGRAADSGVRAIRQGRRNAIPTPLPDEGRRDIPEYGDYDMSPLPVEQERPVRRSKPPKQARSSMESFASRPNTHRGVPVKGNVRTRQVVSRHGKAKAVSQHPINWMLIAVICAGLALAGGIGYLVYMNNSDSGQRITARKRVVACNEAMLELAASTDAVRETDRKALLKDLQDAPPQAYWLVGQEYMDVGDMEDAIMAYRLANILDPSNYDGLLLLGSAYELNNQDDLAEALYLEMTATVSPARPEAYTALINLYLNNDRDPEAAAMMLKAYQSTDRDSFRQQRKDFIPNAPQVDTQHISGRYELEQHITVTSPQGYDIFYTLDDKATLPEGGKRVEDNQTFYYTIDGSIPDPKVSPKYDGSAIVLPSGRVTLRAIAINGYGKQSSTMEVGYKFEVKPYPLEVYAKEDTFNGFTLLDTTLEDFTGKFGQPKQTTDTTYLTVDGQAQHLEYPWGYAVFLLQNNKWQLVRVEMTDSIAGGPRGVGLGSSEKEITAAYKDFGMPPNQDTSRNLYYDDPDSGVVLQNEDGTRTVQYTCANLQNKVLVLQYQMRNDRCVAIDHYYKP